MADKLDPSKLSPTGKYAYLLDVKGRDATDVMDYRQEQIFQYVWPKLIRDPEIARKFSQTLDEEMSEWNEGTEAVTPWGELIESALDLFREQVFPSQET